VNPDDSDPVFEFLEQHRWEDLDGDGYKEPYIVTVHKPTQQVVRVVARWQAGAVDIETDKAKPRVVRIAPDQYFVHYSFIPNSDGSMNSLGFGQLLEPINASVNTVLNQLIDAGTLHNTGGGFIGRGVRLRGGQWSFSPNEWKVVDAPGGALKENIIPLPTREPSQVLFNLLGFLVQAGKDISSVQDVLIGRERITGDMPVGTTMALVEQGLKVFTAIYKRVYRSLTVEFKKLYKLNALYLDPQFTFYLAGQDDKYVVGQRDYEYDDLTVLPVADPNLSSDMQRLLKAQALKDLSGRPGLNEVEVTRRLVKAIQPDNIDKILLSDAQIAGKEPVPWTPPPPPQAVVAQAKAQRLVQQAKESDIRLKMDIMRLQLELAELRAKIGKLKAEAIDKIASAEAREAGQQIDAYRAEIERLATELDARAQAFGQMAQGQGQGQEQIARDEAGGFGLGLDAVSEPQLTDSSRSPRQPAGPVGLDGFGLGLGSPEGAAPRRPVMGRPPKIPMEGASLSVPPEGIPRRLAAPMQEGGPVVQGQPYLVGEAGPEAFVPKSFARDPLYDYESALAYGLKPDETAHWPSRIPGGQHEGLLLKAENHPTFNLTVEAERVLGNSIYKDVDSGRLYSFPADRPVSGRLRRYEPRLGQ
jgi:chaperonin GroES